MKTWILVLLTATALSAQQGIPWGQEFRGINYTLGNQEYPSISGLADGGFMVCWMSWDLDGPSVGIYAQRYGVNDSPVGSEIRVSDNSFADGIYPSVAGLSGGGFVVCWESVYKDNSGVWIYAQLYGADGTPAGGEFRVDSYPGCGKDDPMAASLSGGGFVICWSSGDLIDYSQDGSDRGIYAQRYGVDGEPVGDEFRVNSSTQNDQSDPSVASLYFGGFVTCWISDQDSSGFGVYAQRYESDGKPAGDEFRVDSHPEYIFKEAPSVSGLSDGGFIICWSSGDWYEWLPDQDGSDRGIYAQRYGVDGEPVGDEFRVNSSAQNDQCFPRVAGISDGGFVVCWMSNHEGSSFSIYAQRYRADGKPAGGEFTVKNKADKDCGFPSIASMTSDDFVMCYMSSEQESYNTVIRAKRFPVKPLRHELRPFALLAPEYDATVMEGKPRLNWKPASELTIVYPWELEYTVYYDTLADFSTASVKAAGPDTTVKLPALKLGKTYFWKVLAKTYYGDSLRSKIGAFFVSHNATGVEDEAVPGQFTVLSNYPNPFNPSTTLRFELPKDGYVTLKIYDLSGRLVKTLLSGEQTAGVHTAKWDGTDDAGRKVAAGVYFYQLEFTDATGRQTLTQKMSLVK